MTKKEFEVCKDKFPFIEVSKNRLDNIVGNIVNIVLFKLDTFIVYKFGLGKFVEIPLEKFNNYYLPALFNEKNVRYVLCHFEPIKPILIKSRVNLCIH